MKLKQSLYSLIAAMMPLVSVFADISPYDYHIDYGCWGTITLTKGMTETLYSQYDFPTESKIISIDWTVAYPENLYVSIKEQDWSFCTITGEMANREAKVWCLAKYGSSTYRAYYLVKVNEAPPKPTSITVSPSTMSITVGDTQKAGYSLSPNNARTSVTWSSDDTSIATVGTYTGEVKGVGVGTTYIRAKTSNGKTGYCSVTVEPKAGIQINVTNFPDENFRKYLLDQSYGKDGVLEEEEIKNVKEISVISKDITDLTGIEYFTALTELYCQYNSFASLDVSKNTALIVLSCFYNQLSSLDVSSNTLLKKLYCDTNNLSSLDLSNNTKLEILDCSWNSLTSLDVSNNSELKQISCYMNKIQSKETDDLINSLPNNRSKKSYPLYLYYNGSKITKYPSYLISSAQVAKAKEKGWTPYYYSMMDYEFYEFIGYDPKTVYDFNGDGDIDEGDIMFVVSCIMGTQGTGVDKMKADINGDKKVNATDIVELVKIIKANR